METIPTKPALQPSTLQAAEKDFRDHQLIIYGRTDRMFAVLMVVQWLAGIAMAAWISPKAWEGSSSRVHPHVWIAIFLGLSTTAFPVILAVFRPGRTSTRYVIAIAQMLMGALLIHLTGGRIETHFHIFGSLAFLAFYRDWKVLIPATLVVAADHFLRGMFWPQSVYGVLNASDWRSFEHAGWVLFEVFFLIISCVYSQRDMWEKALKHATLETAEKDFRQMADAMPQIVWTSRSDGWLDYYNQRWFDYTGMTLAETQGWGWAPVLHPDDLQNCLDSWNESVRTGNPYEIRYRFKRASDGIYRWHLGRASAVRDDEGQVLKWFGTCTDIDDQKLAEDSLLMAREELEGRVRERTAELAAANTELTSEMLERKQMEATMRQSEESYRDLFENAQDAIYVHDLNGTYVSANRAAEELVGYKRNEIVGKNVVEFMAPEYVEQIRTNLGKKLEGKGLTAYEIEVRRKDGRSIPVEVSTRLIYENGVPVGVQGMARDITERQRTESERRIIAEIVQGIVTTSNLDELFKLAHNSIRKLLYAENCFVTLFDPSTSLMHFEFWADKFDPAPEPRPIGTGFSSYVLRTGQPILLTEEAKRRMYEQGEVEASGTDCPSWLGVPLRTPSGTIGVLVVQNYEVANAYSKRDLEFLSAVGDQMALAIERKRGEMALQESEVQFKALFDDAPVAYHELDREARIVAVNLTEQRLLGYTASEMEGRFGWEFVENGSPEAARAKLAGDVPLKPYERLFIRKDGTLVPMLVEERLIHDPKGVVTGIRTALHDITDRKRAEMERQVIAEIVESVITTANLDELFRLAQQAINKILPAENCFISLHNLTTNLMHCEYWVDKFDRAPLPRPLGKGFSSYMMRTGQPLLLTKEFKDQMYERGEVELSGTKSLSWLGIPLRTRSRTIGVLVVQHYEQEHAYNQRDLEFLSVVGDQLGLAIERKQTEIELKTNEMQLTAAQKIAHIGSWEWDNVNRKLHWSDELFRIFGHSPGEVEVTFKDYFGHVHPADRKLVTRSIRRVFSGGEFPAFDYRVILPDGAVRTLQVNCEAIADATGRVTKMWGTTQDITERKRAESERDVISEVIQSVNLTSNLDELLKEVHQSLKKVLYAENCCVALYDKQTGLFEAPLFVDLVETNPFPVALSKNCTAKVFSSGRPLLMNEAMFAELVERGEVELVGRPAPSFLAVPLMTPAETIGVIVLQHYEKENVYSQSDVEFLSAVAAQLALAIERKQLESTLRNERAFLRTLIDHLPDSVYVKDLASRKVIANLAEVRLSGVQSETEILGKDDFALYPKELAEKFLADDQVVLQTGQPVINREEYVVGKEGQKTWLLTTKIPLRDENGQISGLIGLGRDITDRKRIEEELKTNEMQMSDAQRIAHLGSWAHDAGSGEVKWSHEEWQIFGLDQREFGPSFEEFLAMVHPDDRHIVKRINERAQLSKEVARYDYRIIRPDGAVRVLRANGSILFDDLGQVVRITGTDQDITEQKQIEAELMKRDSELVEAQHLALMGNWEWDIETNVTTWSDALYEIYGIKRGEMQPSLEGYIQVVHPDDREYVIRLAEDAVSDGQSYSYEHRVLRPDKTVRHHHVKVKAIIGPIGKPIKMFGTAQDITDRVRLESDLVLARDVAIESARLKSEFLANMSHEIRTPMNGVIGMTGLLLDTDLTEEQRDFAETIRSSGDGLLTIINDILDFSKIEAGKLQFETLDFDLSNAVESTVELMAERAHGKHIELASLIYSDVTRSLCGDPGRLRQVLTNLIGNAIKFTERGEVVVRVERDSETDDATVLRFTVSDTGIGVSEAARKTLFQAFTQADGSTTRKYGGTGLGLAISKQLVELMGGEIGVTSAEGKGSTFWFTARFAKQLLPVAHPRPDLLSLDRLHALIVDDNFTNRKILAHQLDSWGMTHEAAESGPRALELLRSAAAQGKPYDLAILDFMMPGMDGFELARTIKSEPAIASIPMVLLTSFGQRGDGTAAREAGIAAYLTKPVRQSQLFDCLANVVHQTLPTADPASSVKLVTKHTLTEGISMSNKLILVAEDNIVNQKVAVRQLQKLGYRADTVANGREALEALGRIPYDLVLMDCQMPEMDGYEATAEIRRLEGATKHTRVVAMTAHALTGDREKCLAAGMDEYITKPVKSEELKRVLGLFLERPNVDPMDEAATASLVDVKRMHEMMGDEAVEFSEILELYLSEMGKNLDQLDVAVASGDHMEIELLAHNCAGTSANCGMNAVAIPFRELEDAGRTAHLENAPAALAQAHLFFARTREFLAQHTSQPVN